jgi:hypothetical protein
VYDELQDYTLGSLGQTQQRMTVRGLRTFSIRRITDLSEFVNDAHGIYLSFYERTGYRYKKERVQIEHFTRWSQALFTFPQVVVLGAYHQGRLAAIDVTYRVDDVIVDDVFFSDTASQQLRVTDALLHAIRESAAASDAQYLYMGLPSGKRSLDASKIMRGCKVLQKPASLRINTFSLFLAKRFRRESYDKLVEMTSPTPYGPLVEATPRVPADSELAA